MMNLSFYKCQELNPESGLFGCITLVMPQKRKNIAVLLKLVPEMIAKKKSIVFRGGDVIPMTVDYDTIQTMTNPNGLVMLDSQVQALKINKRIYFYASIGKR
jgi:hypothetical protein